MNMTIEIQNIKKLVDINKKEMKRKGEDDDNRMSKLIEKNNQLQQ